MPTVAQLGRLQALVERLTPLTRTGPGELIRAQDWNDVVGVLIEVTRAVLAEDVEAKTVPPHEHPDQVKASWLDNTLRAIVERGPLGDPAAEARVSDLERRATRLAERLDKVQNDAREVRDRVSEVSARDLARQADVTSVRRTVDAIDGRRDDLQTLQNTLQSVQRDVRTAVEVGQRLVVDGQPVDFAQFDQRVRAVEEVRGRLTQPNGQLLDATALEARLTGLTNTLVTQAQLDEALRNRSDQIPQGTLDNIRDSVAANVREDLDGQINSRFGDFRTSINAQLDGIDTSVARAVSDATPGLSTSILTTARQEIATAVQRGVQDLRTQTARNLTETAATLRGEVAAQLNDLRQTMGQELDQRLDGRLADALQTIRRDLDGLRDGIASDGQRLSQLEPALQRMATRVETLARDEANARGELQRTLITEMQSRNAVLAASIDQRFSDFGVAQQGQINSAMASLQRTVGDQIQRTAADAAAAEARTLATRLRGEMTAVAQDQIAAVQSNMQSLVTAAVTEAMRGVPGIVSQEVRRATADLPDRVRTEITAFEPRIREIATEVNVRSTTVGGGTVIRSGVITGPGMVSPGVTERIVEPR